MLIPTRVGVNGWTIGPSWLRFAWGVSLMKSKVPMPRYYGLVIAGNFQIGWWSWPKVTREAVEASPPHERELEV